jgi:hypothetical protein
MKIHLNGILVWECWVCDYKNVMQFEHHEIMEITDFLKEKLMCNFCKTEFKNGES